MIDLDRFNAPGKTALMTALRRRDDLRMPEMTDAEADAIAAEANSVHTYGADAPKNREGKRIEQGIGSKGHETTNHFYGIRKFEGEQKYQAAIRKMWKENPTRAAAIGLEQPDRLGA